VFSIRHTPSRDDEGQDVLLESFLILRQDASVASKAKPDCLRPSGLLLSELDDVFDRGFSIFRALMDPTSMPSIVAPTDEIHARIALNEVDSDGLPNDVCYVNARRDTVVVPVPGSGARFAPLTAGCSNPSARRTRKSAILSNTRLEQLFTPRVRDELHYFKSSSPRPSKLTGMGTY